MISSEKVTLLTDGQIWGNNKENQLEVLSKYGNISSVTDLVILTGGYVDTSSSYTAPDDKSLKGRTGWLWTQSSDGDGYVRVVNMNGEKSWSNRY